MERILYQENLWSMVFPQEIPSHNLWSSVKSLLDFFSVKTDESFKDMS